MSAVRQREHVHLVDADTGSVICSTWRVASLTTSDPAEVTCGHCLHKLAITPTFTVCARVSGDVIDALDGFAESRAQVAAEALAWWAALQKLPTQVAS